MIIEWPLAPSSTKRSDTLAIKSQIADLLTHEQGSIYWSSFGNLLIGRITRQEFDQESRQVFGNLDSANEIRKLHNTLILSILYNTTVPTATPSSRHSGWFPKRKRRDGDPSQTNAQDQQQAAKRQKLKHAVLQFTKKERNRLKALPTKTVAIARPKPILYKELAGTFGFGTSAASIPSLPATVKQSAAANIAFQQDYARCQQTQLCSESLSLPDEATLRDRMSFVAYNTKLHGGADLQAAGALSRALEMHLLNILESALAQKTADENDRGRPLSMNHMLSLFEIRPSVLVNPNVGAVERALATAARASDPAGSMTQGEESISPTCAPSPQRTEKSKPALTIAVPPPSGQGPFTAAMQPDTAVPKTGLLAPTSSALAEKQSEEDTLRAIQAAVLAAGQLQSKEPDSSNSKRPKIVLNGMRIEDSQAEIARPEKKRKDAWDAVATDKLFSFL